VDVKCDYRGRMHINAVRNALDTPIRGRNIAKIKILMVYGRKLHVYVRQNFTVWGINPHYCDKT